MSIEKICQEKVLKRCGGCNADNPNHYSGNPNCPKYCESEIIDNANEDYIKLLSKNHN